MERRKEKLAIVYKTENKVRRAINFEVDVAQLLWDLDIILVDIDDSHKYRQLLYTLSHWLEFFSN